ncbi:hypothetical protein C0989_004100 [Termitomyces sp. Mn162]|nr:hypothetical protein C0989_004100 [Termitomyces sp. Mn162]
MEQRCISVSALSSGSHVIHFADGSTYEADLVIGADGIKSVIRDFVTGRPTPLAYSNSVAYRSVVPSEAFKDLKTDMMRPLCWIGKNRHIISYPVQSDQKVFWFCISEVVVLDIEQMNLVFFTTDATIPLGSVDVPLPWAKLVSQDELLHEFSQAGWGEDANLILKEMKNPSKCPQDVLEVYDSIRVARANMVQKLSTLMGNIVEKRGPGGGTNAQIQEQLRDIYHPIWHHDLKEEVKRAVTSVYGL